MNKKVLLVVGAIVLVVVAFAAGALVGPRVLPGALGGPVLVGGPDGQRGPMAQLSADDRATLQNMSESERQAFFQERMGSAAPGARGGRGGAMLVQGEVLEVAEDSFTVKTTEGGSQVVYTDAETILALADRAQQSTVVKGSKVTAFVEPEGDNVLSAVAVIIR